MDNSTESLIQSKWEDELCPIINGIVFDSGEIIVLECSRLTRGQTLEIKVRPLVRATLRSFLEFNDDRWTSITELASTPWEAGGIRASCGEGGFGSDGFVAVSRLTDNHLNWIAFFQFSNPFNKVSIVETNIIAVSTNGHEWTFPIRHPELVTIRSA